MSSLRAVLLGMALVVSASPLQAGVELMAGQRARPLSGTFNRVPVLHSNQPEEVEGPGILISTTPGVSYAAETGMPLRHAEYTFNGEFGIHMHHKYFPSYRSQIRAGDRRTELTLGLILINPGRTPVRIVFDRGAVRNSFEAPYLSNNLLGVKPLGARPWNTGPGDATAVQMLRGQLDRRLSEAVVLPPRSRLVLFRTPLPALGIANALLRGHSNGPFQMAVVAASNPQGDGDLIQVLDQQRLAPGRVYLNRIADIQSGRVFSRVGGVALGDTYTSSLKHDLRQEGPLHVPLTSTSRHHFGTREVQVNPLASRMVDSALNNVGTYGVRFDVDLSLYGSGLYELVLSHPAPSGGTSAFTAFRGSMQVSTPEGLQDLHVGMRSGQSLSLTTLNLRPGVANPVRLSLVYPADATPGHLLSVVPATQLAMVQERQRRQPVVSTRPATAPKTQASPRPSAPKPTATAARSSTRPAGSRPQPQLSTGAGPSSLRPPSRLSSPRPIQLGVDQELLDRYREAMEAQQQQMQRLMGR